MAVIAHGERISKADPLVGPLFRLVRDRYNADIPMTKFNRQQQRELAVWALACARHVQPFFSRVRTTDARPRAALTALRAWLRTGIFSMKTIRQASLAAHAAARDSLATSVPAAMAARAAGQAVATAHVAEHALGAAYYALKTVAAADPAQAGAKINREIAWQLQRLPEALRPVWQRWLDESLPKNMRLALVRAKATASTPRRSSTSAATITSRLCISTAAPNKV
jgi:hypothetical protein